jgi:ABC-2 type transport system ATP-binding protein
MSVIEAENLTKLFGDLTAVNHISFKVEKGEIFGFLGPNGAGKTTTIRMLTGLSEPSEGSASIMGYDISKDPYNAKEHFGVVPEISNIYDELSCWDNLMFAGELYGMSKGEMEGRARELMDIFELSDFKKKKVRGFSKGMKRKLTITMALINNPQILFLDEPTSGLDVESSLKLREIISNLNKEGATIFLTTHNIEEANILANRIGIIVKGRLAVIDSPERLKRTIQASQSVEVAFDECPDAILEELANLPFVEDIHKRGDKFRLFTKEPSLVVMDLLKYMESRNLKPLTLNTLGPSLEDVFLMIVKKGMAGQNHES